WLPPDNYQEHPAVSLAHRTSPTNMGLALLANLGACDFGYIPAGQLLQRTANAFDSMDAMERHEGHFYNWYDTRTLAPLPPLYVSTVDSGNLAAALLTLKQACEGMPKEGLIHAHLLEALRDYCLQLRKAVPFSARSATMMRLIAALQRQLECRPTDLFFWEG